MSYRVTNIDGIKPEFAERLLSAGIATTEDLLERCASARGRGHVSQEVDISPRLLLSWSNKADLMRLAGIGPQYADLLEAAGVDTVRELRNRNALNLATRMFEVNAKRRFARVSPPASVVARWIAAAREAEPRITY